MNGDKFEAPTCPSRDSVYSEEVKKWDFRNYGACKNLLNQTRTKLLSINSNLNLGKNKKCESHLSHFNEAEANARAQVESGQILALYQESFLLKERTTVHKCFIPNLKKPLECQGIQAKGKKLFDDLHAALNSFEAILIEANHIRKTEEKNGYTCDQSNILGYLQGSFFTNSSKSSGANQTRACSKLVNHVSSKQSELKSFFFFGLPSINFLYESIFKDYYKI